MNESIVVGAGIWGCTVARRLAEAGVRVRVLERREAIGGNARCETDPATGIEIHSYGSHIFHTHNREVWDFVRRFTDFNGYQHKVLARYHGRTYHLPLGLTLINKFFGVELTPSEVSAFMADETHAKAIFDAFFRGYTSKQWGCAPEKIDSSIVKRVPVRSNYDTNYFNDYWQGIPSDGYNRMFERMLDHPNIAIECGVDVGLDDIKNAGCRVFYSGAIDRLFGYVHGELPWRSLRFETERLKDVDFQGTSVVNYTEYDVPYTRIHEFKHYHPENIEMIGRNETIIMREYPMAWQRLAEPYYPIKSAESDQLHSQYLAEVQHVRNLVIGGRLGAYRYYDMDQAMASALEMELP